MKIYISMSAAAFNVGDRVAWYNEGSYSVGTVYRINGATGNSVEFDAGFKLPNLPNSSLIKLPNKTKKLKKDISKEQLDVLLAK